MRHAFQQAGCTFTFAVEVRYCNTACVLAESGVGAAVVDPFSPTSSGRSKLVVRPCEPETPVIAHAIWSGARLLSRLAEAFLRDVRTGARQAAATAIVAD